MTNLPYLSAKNISHSWSTAAGLEAAGAAASGVKGAAPCGAVPASNGLLLLTTIMAWGMGSEKGSELMPGEGTGREAKGRLSSTERCQQSMMLSKLRSYSFLETGWRVHAEQAPTS